MSQGTDTTRTSAHGDILKWETLFRDFQAWDTPRQRAVQKKEARVIARWLLDLHLPHYDILEIGCGNGYVGKHIAEYLHDAGMDFSYHFTDLLPQCVEVSRITLADFPEQERLSFSTLDAYSTDAVLGIGTQSIIVSTGFAAAATSASAVPAVARALRDGGILIADFVNHFSPSIFLPRPVQWIKTLSTYLRKEKNYHFGILGIRSFFVSHSLHLARSSTIRFRRNPLICMFTKKA